MMTTGSTDDALAEVHVRLLPWKDREHGLPELSLSKFTSDPGEWLESFREWLVRQPDYSAISLIVHLDNRIDMPEFLQCIARGGAVLRLNRDREWKVGEQGQESSLDR